MQPNEEMWCVRKCQREPKISKIKWQKEKEWKGSKRKRENSSSDLTVSDLMQWGWVWRILTGLLSTTTPSTILPNPWPTPWKPFGRFDFPAIYFFSHNNLKPEFDFHCTQALLSSNACSFSSAFPYLNTFPYQKNTFKFDSIQCVLINFHLFRTIIIRFKLNLFLALVKDISCLSCFHCKLLMDI